MAVIEPLMLYSNVVSHALMHFDYRPQKRDRGLQKLQLYPKFKVSLRGCR